MCVLGGKSDRDTGAYISPVEQRRSFSGWRASTIDVDISILPEQDQLQRALPELKETLHLNIELACPADFIPELLGRETRSLFTEREGKISFCHYDLYAQTALAKIERRHAQDVTGV